MQDNPRKKYLFTGSELLMPQNSQVGAAEVGLYFIGLQNQHLLASSHSFTALSSENGTNTGTRKRMSLDEDEIEAIKFQLKKAHFRIVIRNKKETFFIWTELIVRSLNSFITLHLHTGQVIHLISVHIYILV